MNLKINREPRPTHKNWIRLAFSVSRSGKEGKTSASEKHTTLVVLSRTGRLNTVNPKSLKMFYQT